MSRKEAEPPDEPEDSKIRWAVVTFPLVPGYPKHYAAIPHVAMNHDLIMQVIESPTEDSIEALFGDEDTILWVDWREEDEGIVEGCASIIQTELLSAEIVDVDNDAGFEMYITYKGNRVKVPLEAGLEDRHITIVTLNEVMNPDFEIRYCIDSGGADTLAFLPLTCDKWRELEAQYGDEAAKRFYRLQMKPNVFTDPLPF